MTSRARVGRETRGARGLPEPEEGNAPVISGHRHVVVPTPHIGVEGRGTIRPLRGRKTKGGITDSEFSWQHL